MKHTLIALAVVAASFSAQATNYTVPDSPSTSTSTSTSGAVAGAVAGSDVDNVVAPVTNVNTSVTNAPGSGSDIDQHTDNVNIASPNVGGGTAVASGGKAEASNALSLTLTYEATKRAAASAFAPTTAIPNGVCATGVSAGLQVPSAGIAYGQAIANAKCDMRYEVVLLATIGLGKTAIQRACQDDDMEQAIKDGKEAECTATERKAAAAQKTTGWYTGNDPIVLARQPK